MRQTSGSIVCPSCGKLIDVNEERCPFCGRWQPGMFGYATSLSHFAESLDPTAGITWFCILLYLIALALDPRAALSSQGGIFEILSPSGRSLLMLGMTSGAAASHGHWYTVLSATFLHGGLLHIGFNLLWIRSIGPTIEDGYGPARYFVIFMVASVGGFLVSDILSGAPTVGASGGIFGLLAATVLYGRAHGGHFGDAITRQALLWAGILLVLGFMGSRTNNLAHLGGFGFGYLAARFFLPEADRREGLGVVLTALAFAAGSILAVIFSLITFAPYFMKG
jgi:rhomboid protease GluP